MPKGDRPRVAYSGEPGSYAEDAVLVAFDDPQPLGTGGFREVFRAVESAGAGGADAGVLPIENLVNGTVRETYDLLLEHDLAIVAEVIVPVRLCLAALPGQRLDEIERVSSHVQALGQAEPFLRSRPWTLLTTYNTAGAGTRIAEAGERGAAAILSPRAAEIFGLEILAADIQAVPDNRTRFLVVAREAAPTGLRASGDRNPMRTTLVFAVRNEPGALFRCLGVFAEAGLNLSKLESRPSRSGAWEYVFWADLDADARDGAGRATLDELREVAASIRVLGTYRRAPETRSS
jgi:prephenate dehydratase